MPAPTPTIDPRILATHVASFGVTPGFIFETMGGLPAYGAVLVPGSGRQVYDILTQFNLSAGFG
jgi:hypothetical protein